MMRLLFCAGLCLSAGCLFLLERLDGESCGRETIKTCLDQDVLTLCQDRDVFLLDCEIGCDLDNNICVQHGDNIISAAFEECEDNNFIDGDGCDADRQLTCGNARLDPTNNETCDDGNSLNGDGCDITCLPTGCGSGVSTAGELCFGAPISLPSPRLSLTPKDVALSDLDQDGDLDLAVLSSEDSAGEIVIFNNEGSFLVAQVLTVAARSSSLQAADLNQDTRPDLIIASQLDNKVHHLLQTQTGFAAPVSTSTNENSPHALTSGDFDNDGDPDLAVAHQSCNNINDTCRVALLFSQEGPQIFTSDLLDAGLFRTQKDIANADLDGDSFPEIFAAFSITKQVGVAQNASGSLREFEAPGSSIITLGVTPTALDTIAGIDLLVLTRELDGASSLVRLQNQGALSFSLSATHPLPDGATALLVEDLNGGAEEVMLLFEAPPRVEIRDEGAQLLSTINLGGSPSRVRAGDLNGDSLPDLVIVNPSAKNFSLLLSDP